MSVGTAPSHGLTGPGGPALKWVHSHGWHIAAGIGRASVLFLGQCECPHIMAEALLRVDLSPREKLSGSL